MSCNERFLSFLKHWKFSLRTSQKRISSFILSHVSVKPKNVFFPKSSIYCFKVEFWPTILLQLREKIFTLVLKDAPTVLTHSAYFRTGPGFCSTSPHWIMIEALTIKTKQIFNTREKEIVIKLKAVPGVLLFNTKSGTSWKLSYTNSLEDRVREDKISRIMRLILHFHEVPSLNIDIKFEK